MKKNMGKPQKTTVKDVFGETIGIFNSIDECRQTFYPSHGAGYLSAVMYQKAKNNTFVDDALGLSFHREQGGRTHNQKRYRVVYRNNGLEEIYNSRKELLAALCVGQKSFSQQLKHYGSYKNSEVQIWEI